MARWCRNNFAPKQKKGERAGWGYLPLRIQVFCIGDCTLSLFSDARTVVEFIRVLVEASSSKAASELMALEAAD